MHSFRLSYSGKAVHRVFASCGQEAFFEGHVHALQTLGGVPRSKVRYDNLKGGVEGQIGYFRRNHFTPVPEVESLAELNGLVEQWDRHDGRRRIGSRARTIDEYFEDERPLLMPLPEERFETGRVFTPRVDRYSQITVRTNRYSVPVRLIGKRVSEAFIAQANSVAAQLYKTDA